MGLYFNIALFLPFNKLENKNIIFLGTILESDYSNEYYNRYLVKVKKIGNEKFLEFKCYINTNKDEKFSCGDIIKANGNYTRGEKSRNFKGFSYKNYLLQRKVFGIIEIDSINKIGKNSSVEVFFYNIKEKMAISIENSYKNTSTRDFLKCVLLGINLKDANIKENFKNSNLSHILAISGMHVSYIILAIDLIKIKNKKIDLIVKLIILNMYLLITGISVSCLRACMMYSLLIISKLCYRKNNIYITALYTLIFSILYNFYNIFNAGMWLSYGGMLGIILFHKFIYKFLLYKFKIKNKLIQKIIEISCISISAQIFIFPIMMYFFNTISLNFLISNLAIYYFIGPIIILGYISIILYFFKLNILINILVNILVNIENWFVQILLKIIDFISNYFDFNIYTITPNLISVLMYFCMISVIIYKFNLEKISFIKLIYKFQIKNIILNMKFIFIDRKNKKITLILIIILLFNFFINSNINLCKNLEISFIDVGQGDCTYIRTPQNKHILIDSGEGGKSEEYDYGKNVVLPYLLDRKITKLDYIFISHFDSDHVGGMFYILENIKVEKIFIGIQAEEYENYIILKRIAEEKNIPIIMLKQGDRINIEKEIYINILFPDTAKTIEENTINNNSLVFILYYCNFSIIFTGDIEKIAESELIKKYQNLNVLNSTILKVAHHGSKSSTTEEFIKLVNPKIALIGVEKENSYGHPNNEVIERLEKYGAKIYRTDIYGEIRIKINKKGIYDIKTHIE